MKILVISPTPSHPQNAGNRSRIFNLLNALRNMGHDIYLLHIQKEIGDAHAMNKFWGKKFSSIPYVLPKKKFMHKISISWKTSPRQHLIDEWYDSSIDYKIMALHQKEKFDAAIVEYVFFSKALENFGKDVLKIIDTHDVFTDRYAVYKKSGLEPRWFSTTAKQERKGLQRADVIVAIQDNDKNFFRSLCDRKVVSIGYITPLCHKEQPEKAINKGILFVGSENLVNIKSINFFLQECLPNIKKVFPDVKLYLAGKVGSAFNNNDSLITLGEIDTLDEIYSMAKIVINPVQLGTGLSIKSIEALGFGKILVSTTAGIRGLQNGAGKAFLVADDPKNFAQYIIKLFKDEEYAKKLSKEAFLFAKTWNEKNLAELQKIFLSIDASKEKKGLNTEEHR